MASAATIDQPQTALVPATNAAAAVVLLDNEKFDAFYAKLKADVDATPIDLATKKGRDAIASVAAKVRSEKASIDKDRLRLTSEWRNMTAQVNGAWNGIKERMDALAVEARKPLTEWEEAEKARKDECDAIVNRIVNAGMVSMDDTVATVRARGTEVHQTQIDPERFGDGYDGAVKAKEYAIATLRSALARLIREEEERAELEKLRAEAAARAEADRIAAEKEALERREGERVEAERIAAEKFKAEEIRQAALAEERRIATEKAEAERIERAKIEAAEAAERNAQRQARIDQEARDRAHAEELAAERRKVEEASRAEQQRQAAVRAEQEAQELREADEAHRADVKAKAAGALVAMGVAERTAYRIVQAICANDIPNVTLRF